MSDSTHQRLAREQFPQFAIEGDGEWALVCPDTGRVLLAVWALLLSDQRNVPYRRLVRLKAPRIVKARRSTSNPADQEKD